MDEIRTLSEVARSQPHAAYAAFIHGLSARWIHFVRVTDLEEHSATVHLQPLKDIIHSLFIPELTGHSPPGDLVRELLALPAQQGGLGKINPVAISAAHHATSKKISAPLVNLVVSQNHQIAQCTSVQQWLKVMI